jgi:hypothetical protein
VASFGFDLQWARQYDRYVRAVLGQVFIVTADEFKDVREATDFEMVYTMRPLTFACRLRRSKWARRCPLDITLRSSRPSGTTTEWQKVMSGFGDYLFYGFADETPPRVSRWVVVDLERIRMANTSGLLRFGEMTNTDNSSRFRVLDASHIDELGCVHATSRDYWSAAGVNASLFVGATP